MATPQNLTPQWIAYLRRREASLLERVRTEVVRLREQYPNDPDRMPASLSYFMLLSVGMELETLGLVPEPIGKH
jgi:hypothetical protein